jgi:hypothetical protein
LIRNEGVELERKPTNPPATKPNSPNGSSASPGLAREGWTIPKRRESEMGLVFHRQKMSGNVSVKLHAFI